MYFVIFRQSERNLILETHIIRAEKAMSHCFGKKQRKKNEKEKGKAMRIQIGMLLFIISH